MPTSSDIRRKLRLIARDTILIGVVLCGVGTFIVYIATQSRYESGWSIAAAVAVLLLPGAWFIYAGSTIRHANGQMVMWSLRVVAVQLAACVLAVVSSVTMRTTSAFAACGLAFFLPAQLVLLYQLWQARELIRAEEAARGFTVNDVLLAQPVDARGEEIVDVAEIIPEAMIAPPKD